jgi:hypothetical protein
MPLVVFILLGSIYFLIKKENAFGMADYIVVLAVSFLIPSTSWPIFLMLCGGLGISFSVVLKRKNFPFIPPILIAVLLINIINYLTGHYWD